MKRPKISSSLGKFFSSRSVVGAERRLFVLSCATIDIVQSQLLLYFVIISRIRLSSAQVETHWSHFSFPCRNIEFI